MSNINERLAVVETQIEQILEEGKKREYTQEEILNELRTTRATISALEGELLRYKGFLGGVTFVLSCIGVFLYKFAMPLYNLVKVKTGG